MSPVIIDERSTHNWRMRRIAPIQAIALSFLALIVMGTVLLSLPIAQQPGVRVGVLDALFTATSATCVTGLVTHSTAETWSRFGQVVILVLIQIGGLGYMTAATIVAMLLGVRIGLRTRLHLREAHGVLGLGDAVQVVRYVAIATLLIEGISFLFYSWRFHYGHGLPWGKALYEGIFYAVSTFTNAGFDLAPGFAGLTLPRMSGDILLLFVFSIVIILGGLGFGVLAELMLRVTRRQRLSLHARLVLATTAVLLFAGMLLFMFSEAHNPFTLAQQEGPAQRLITSWFMSVTPRSSGFSPIPVSDVSPPTLFWLGLLMIIGGGPNSNAGGVKITTFAIIILAIITLIRGKRYIEVFRRRISGELVRLSLSLVSIYLLVILAAIITITFVEITLKGLPPGDATMALFGRLLFEVLSAFGTVGLSAGVTPALEPASRVLLIIGMFIGRLGPLSFVFVFAQARPRPLRRLPEEPVMTG